MRIRSFKKVPVHRYLETVQVLFFLNEFKRKFTSWCIEKTGKICNWSEFCRENTENCVAQLFYVGPYGKFKDSFCRGKDDYKTHVLNFYYRGK